MARKPTYKESEQKVKEPEQKRMNFIHKITSVLTGSRFYFHSLVLCLLAVSLAFYICFVGTITVEAEDQKRVLILHSYHIGYPWTDNVSEGITSILNKEENVEIIYEHMDTKRYFDKPYLKKLLHIYKYKYSGAIPDVIICSDDNALNFLLKNRDELFTSVPIVFCGINNFTDSRIAGHKNITGVVENPDILGTLQIALRLHPGTRQVAVVHDQTKSALANIERLRKIAPDFEKQVEFKYLTDVTISELREALRALPSETVVLHLSFARDRVGVFLPLKEASKLVNDNSAGPVYTCWDVRMSYPGHCGGKVVSGRMQGEIAAQMAWRILHGESTDSIDIVRESPNVYMFDYEQVKRFGLSKNDLPENSIIVNEPFSFYEKYKGSIWITIGSFAFLLFLIVFLITNILRLKRVEEALRIERDNLRNIFESMEDGVYIVNQQYDIQYVNPVLKKDFGPYEGIKCYRYFHERDEVCPWCKNKDVWAGKTVRWEWYSFKNERTYDLIDSPMTLSDGSIGKLEILRDITEHKQVEEAVQQSEKKYRTLVEESFDGIFIQKGPKIIFTNQRLNEMLGYEEGELLGLDHWLLYHPDYQQLTRERAKARMRGEKVSTHYEVKLQ
ncbi:MAG: PAS domain S-box protein, partial [Deltaproteobacteria bacterium]|nr:PAS domain S-box protein [Deltaproteobacteria bacterium]